MDPVRQGATDGRQQQPLYFALITILCEYFRKTLLTLRDAIHGSANKQTRPVEYTVYVYVLCF